MANKSPTIGANVDFTFAGTTTDGQNAPFALGTTVDGDGVRYMFVQASGAISTSTNEPYALAIDSAGQAAKMTTALALKRHRLGVAPRLIISDNDFFWARIYGAGSVVPMRVAASAAADSSLRTTTSAGRLGTASTVSAVVYAGCVLTVAASASGASTGSTIRNCILSANSPVRQSSIGTTTTTV